MSTTNNLGDFLTSVADAIRTKKGTTDSINAQNFAGEIESIINPLQWKCDNLKTLYYEFYHESAPYGYPPTTTSFDDILNGLDTSKVVNMGYMFHGQTQITTLPVFDTSSMYYAGYMFAYCYRLTAIPHIDTSSCTNMHEMCQDCRAITTIPPLNTSKARAMNGMLYGCSSLISIPELDTSSCTDMGDMFGECTNLTTVSKLNMIKVTRANDMFYECPSLTDVTLINIKTSLNFSDSPNLSLDSIVNTIKELWDYTGDTTVYRLTLGTTNRNKLANTYVKLIIPTEEQIAADEYVTSKMPCKVCESTDIGAMLITDYVARKNWSLT